MTRKDYELIARTLRTLREELENNKDNGYEFEDLIDIEGVALRLASSFQADNPRFQASKFLKAVRA